MTGNYNLPEDDDLHQIIKRLTRRIEALERHPRSPSTSVDNGALIVKKGSQVIGVLGDLGMAGFNLDRPDGSPQMGFLFYRDDGTLAWSLYDDDPNDAASGYHQFVGMWDRRQIPIFMEDFRTGYGLARPFLPGSLVISTDPTRWTATTSATFVSADESYMFFENPSVYVDFLMYCDAATTGEARLLIGGTQWGPTISGGFGYSNFNNTFVMAAADVSMAWKQVRIEHRRTSGTGNVRTAFRTLYGRQAAT